MYGETTVKVLLDILALHLSEAKQKTEHKISWKKTHVPVNANGCVLRQIVKRKMLEVYFAFWFAMRAAILYLAVQAFAFISTVFFFTLPLSIICCILLYYSSVHIVVKIIVSLFRIVSRLLISLHQFFDTSYGSRGQKRTSAILASCLSHMSSGQKKHSYIVHRILHPDT